MHPRLVTFFRGAMTELRGAYEKSEGAPSAVAGSLREEGIRRAIEHSLPTIAKLYSGEIVDRFGGHSGQLDGMIVHATGSAIATSPTEPRIALAEGVVAIVESKSNLSSQWDEVQATWDKIRVLRRFREPRGVWGFRQPQASDWAFPFIVMARAGWRRPETLRDKAAALRASFGDVAAPSVIVVQCDPAGIGLALADTGGMVTDDDGHAKLVMSPTPPIAGMCDDDQERWRPLAIVWRMLTEQARTILHTPIDWVAYENLPHE